MTDSNGVTRLGMAYVSVANVAPDVNPGADVTVAEGTAVSFVGAATDAGGSGDIALIQWDFGYDGGTFQADASATGTLTPNHTFSATGDYSVALQVTDTWGAVTLQTLHVTVTAVAPTAMVANAGTTSEGTPVTFTVSAINDPNPNATFSYWAQWNAGAGFAQVSPADLTTNPDGSVSFQHVFDDNSAPAGYTVTIRVMDGDGAYTDYLRTVVVNNVAPTAAFGPSGGATLVSSGLPILFSSVTDPSNADTQAGFTFHFSVNGGAYTTTSSSQFFLPNDTPGLNYTLSGYVTDKNGGASPVYSTTVTTGMPQILLANHGTGSVLLEGTLVIGPNQYFLGAGISSAPHVTLLTSGASYTLYSNGNFGQVDASAGVSAVQLTVRTDVLPSSFLSGLTPAPGSGIVTGTVASSGNGDIGLVMLPAGNATLGASTLTVEARGDLGGVAGPTGTSSKRWAQAVDLVFSNLNGSITGLDSIGVLTARGKLGRTIADQVWANAGIGQLSAFAIPGTVTADRNQNLSDMAMALSVGQGGISGVLDLGNVSSATVGGMVNQLRIARLTGNFRQVGPGNIAVLALQDAAAPMQAPDIVGEGGDVKVIGVQGKFGNFKIGKVQVAGELKLVVHGSLQVTGNIEGDSITKLQVSGQLTVDKDILARKGHLAGVDIKQNLSANRIEAADGILDVTVGGKLTANGIFSKKAIDTLVTGGDLNATIQAPGGIKAIRVGGTWGLPPNPLVRLSGSAQMLQSGYVDQIDVQGGDLGRAGLGERLYADGIGQLNVSKGNLRASVGVGEDGLGKVIVTKTIFGNLSARGGDIGLVKADRLLANIRAERLTNNNNAGGSIAEINIFNGAGVIWADNYIGSVRVSGTEMNARLVIKAQSGAEFDANLNIKYDVMQKVMRQALQFQTQKQFQGRVTFTYGKAARAFRVAYKDNDVLFTRKGFAADDLMPKSWQVKKSAVLEDSVNLEDVTFLGPKFDLPDGNFTKPGLDDTTKNWKIEIVPE